MKLAGAQKLTLTAADTNNYPCPGVLGIFYKLHSQQFQMGSYRSFLHPDGIWTGAKPVEQGESRTEIGKLKEKKRVLRRLASHHTLHSLATLAF